MDELHKTYGWNLTAKSLCTDVGDFERILRTEFGTIITYLELGKAEEEIQYVQNELEKNKLKLK